MCSFKKYPFSPPPTQGTFVLDPPPPSPPRPRISIPGGACHIPPPPPLEFPEYSNLVGYPLERIFPSKMLIIPGIKREKNLFIYVNTVSNNLNFVL